MSPKGFFTLFAATLVSIALAAWAVASRQLPVPQASLDRPLLPDLAAKVGEVAAIEVVHQDRTLHVRREDGRWVLAEKADFPVDPAKVRQIVLGLAELRVIEAKTRNPQKFARLELEDPGKDAQSTLIRLRDEKGGTLAEVIVGKRKFSLYGPGKSGSYVRLAGDDQAWLADRPLDAWTDPLDWVDRNLVWLPRDEIAEVRLHVGTPEEVVVRRAGSGDPFILEGLEEGEVADTTKIERLVSALGTMTLSDIESRDALPFPEDAPVARWTTFDGLVIDVAVLQRETPPKKKDGKPEVQYWVRLEARAGEPLRKPSAEAAGGETVPPAGDDAGGASAKQAEKSEESRPVAERVAELNARYGHWVFEISKFLGERLLWKKADLLEKPSS